jgi:ABC-type dipeptide/oligopeptide/nickel transport systems, permease components
MRVVDIFYCIPSLPIIIIIGAAMDAQRVDPKLRMIYLMLTLGFLGWAGIARLVRGQILSLREQEYMIATEACGIKVSRRIFRHLIPNVIPQLIVYCTMGLGSVIITEATLSFLGLGVKFPFASWGNIINDVNNTYVLTTYWFIWIPAGILLLMTVLAFNLVGDGLRDAFDPKMKR